MMVSRAISQLPPVGTGPKTVLDGLCSHSLDGLASDINLIPYEIGVLVSGSQILSRIASLAKCNSMARGL